MSVPKRGMIRRLKRRFQAGDVLVFTVWTLLRLEAVENVGAIMLLSETDAGNQHSVAA